MTDRTYRLTRAAEQSVEFHAHEGDTANTYISGFVDGGQHEAKRSDDNREELLVQIQSSTEGGNEVTLSIGRFHDQYKCYAEGRVQGVVSDTLDEAMLGALSQQEDDDPFALSCSFCQQGQQAVKRLVQGKRGVAICNECIRLAHDIVADPNPQPGPHEVPGELSLVEGGLAAEKPTRRRREPLPCPECGHEYMQPHKGLPPGLGCSACEHTVSYEDLHTRDVTDLLRAEGLNESQICTWMVKPQEAFGGRNPRRLILDGEAEKLKDFLMARALGTHVT